MHNKDSTDERIKNINKSFEKLDNQFKKTFQDKRHKAPGVWRFMYFTSVVLIGLCIWFSFRSIVHTCLILTGLIILYTVRRRAFGIVITLLSVVITALDIFDTKKIVLSSFPLQIYIIIFSLVLLSMIIIIISFIKILNAEKSK